MMALSPAIGSWRQAGLATRGADDPDISILFGLHETIYIRLSRYERCT
jgi:hypothetical protein